MGDWHIPLSFNTICLSTNKLYQIVLRDPRMGGSGQASAAIYFRQIITRWNIVIQTMGSSGIFQFEIIINQALSQCWADAMGQHQPTIGQTPRVCWEGCFLCGPIS